MKIGLFLYPGCMPAGLFAFGDLLQAANLRMGNALFECGWVSPGGGSVSANAVQLVTERLATSGLDAVLIPGAWRDSSSLDAAGDAALASAIRTLDAGTQVWSYCTGVYLAALAGKLDGQAATTTWWLRDIVRTRFPNTDWKLHSTCVFSGPVATASGVTGYQPIALGLIERHASRELVSEIRKFMVLPRPLTQHSPFQEVAGLIQQGALVRKVVHWVEATPAADLHAGALAAHLHMSSRTLGRKLHRETGYSTGRLMRLIKLNQVGDQLIGTNRPINAISDALGFADDTVLRRSFRQVTGTTPGEYRQRFGQ